MNLLTGDQINKNKWDDLLLTSPYSTPFQSQQYYQLFNSVPNLSAKVYALEQNNELLSLCVVTLQLEKGVKAFFSRRAIIYGGPISLENNKETITLLLNKIAADLKRKAIYVETRNFNDYGSLKEPLAKTGWGYEPYLNYHLNCTSEEIATSGLNTNRKRQIKKALKTGVTLEEAKNVNDVNDYYAVLKDLYINKIKKPLLPYEFFKHFFELSAGKILLVKYNDKIIGGIVCPILENKTIYELYICGQDQEFKDQSPSVMATYAAIEYGFKNGLKKFDFMGAGKPNEDYGVRDFKEKFGGELVEHGRFIKINNPLLFKAGITALKLLKKLKK